MKKLPRLLFIVVILFTFTVLNVMAGSGKKENKKSTAGTKDPITFTMFVVELNPNDDGFASPVAKVITEKTGVNLDIEYNIADGQQKLSLMAASGDYPDIVFAKGDLSILRNAGGIIKLDELIENHGPNILKMYGEDLVRLRYSMDDPYIYSLGADAVGREAMRPGNGFLLQHAVVKELGFPRMETLKDFEEAIKAYKEKYPTIDGQPTIGLSILADDWRALISLTNPACFATGGPDDGEWYIDQKTYEAVRHHTRPIEREYFRWLNHMNATGLLDPDSFVQKYDQYKAKIASGRVLGLADAQWEVEEPSLALRKAGKEERMYGFYPLTLKKGIKNAEFMSAGYLGGFGVAITTSCKDPVRAIEFLDWMATEEANILTYWGIEGEHYFYDENGVRKFLPEIDKMRIADPAFRKKTGIGNYVYPWPAFGNTIKDSTGNFYAIDNLQQLLDDQTDIENEVLAAYGAVSWKDLYPKASEFPVKPYGAAWLINIDDPDYKAAEQKILNTGYKRIPEAILADPSEFDAVYDKYIDEIEVAGLKMVTEKYNIALKERIKMWSKD